MYSQKCWHVLNWMVNIFKKKKKRKKRKILTNWWRKYRTVGAPIYYLKEYKLLKFPVKNYLALSTNIEPANTPWDSNSTSRYIPNWHSCVCAPRFLELNIHGNAIIDQKLKTTQISAKGWLDRLLYMNTVEYYTAIKTKEL